MSKILADGKGIQPTVSSPSANNLPDSCNNGLRVWVAAELQTVRELIPGPLMSDHATEILLDSLEKIATEIGPERFHEVVMKAIETCERRPTIAVYRKLAGLTTRLSPQDEALAAGWELVTLILTRFLQWDGEGQVSVQPRIAARDGKHFEEIPPEIPEGVKKAVTSLGGWKALANSYPEWYSQRFQAFKELYRPSPKEIASLLTPKTPALAEHKGALTLQNPSDG
jgi:hypothetical protein